MSIFETLHTAIAEAQKLTDSNNDLQERNALLGDKLNVTTTAVYEYRSFEKATNALLAALRYMSQKAKYEFNAPSGSTSRFDCSSLMQKIWGEAGVTLPRNSRQQSLLGVEVEVATFGCLVIIDRDNSGKADHVGMALDDTYMIHIAGNPEGINITKFRERYAGKILTIRGGFF